MPEARENDELLVARAQGGDGAAFGQLVERYQDAIFNGISRMVGRREDVEDLAQEVFLKAFRGIARFDGRSALYTWLYAIAINTVISHRRKVGARANVGPMPSYDGDDEGGSFEMADDADPPDAIAEQRELRAMVERAIDRIDPEYRVALVLRDVEGFDYETIADLLGVPQGTVKSRIHRARSALREQLKDAVA